MKQMDATDRAWCAGLFEGEGCFTTSGPGRPRATLAMTDEDVVRKFHRLMGFGSVSSQHQLGIGTKTVWYWRVYSLSDVALAIDTLLPMLGERRAARAQEIRQLCVR
jgi:hypothetical protein